jgi:hypothetical protein
MKIKLASLFLSFLALCYFNVCYAQSPACGDEKIQALQKQKLKNYDKVLQDMNERIKYYVDQHTGTNQAKTSSASGYTIPVVFHVIHTTGESYGTGSNISYQQILSQLNAMNAAFAMNYPAYNGQTHPTYAENTDIQFCLAALAMPSSVSFYNGPGGIEKGVMRYANNVLTDHQMTQADATALANLTHPSTAHFPFDKYLNIWLVSSISDNTPGIVMGYAPKPLMGAYPLDGVVMRSDIVGDNSTGNTYNLSYALTQGKIMAHEIGHYLNLMHIFEGGCAGANAVGSSADACDLNGDMICDIEPCTTQNINCNAPVPNTCSTTYATGTTTNDMIEDYMSYADDDCMTTFTQGQKLRMHATLNTLRSGLWQISNLAATGVIGSGGCSNAILYIDIAKPLSNYCTNAPLALSNPTVGNTSSSWNWVLAGGSPSMANTNSITVTYTAPGLYYAKLTISDGTFSLTDSIPIAITSCTLDPKKLDRSNWLFGDSCSISFATGAPSINNLVLKKQTQKAFEVAVSMSDSLGNLLFYSDGFNIWDNTHTIINTSPIFGWDISAGMFDYHGSSVYGFTCFKVPKQPGKYALICIPPQETNAAVLNAYCKISCVIYDANTHTVTPFQSLTHPSIYTPGTNVFSEDLCVVPHCNGVDYWVVARGWNSDYTNGNMYAFLFNQNGLNPTAAPIISGPFVSPTGVGGIKSNPAGDKLICGSGIGKFLLYNFNQATGVVSNEVLLPVAGSVDQACLTCIFSPNGQYIYLKYGTSLGGAGVIQQVDANSLVVVKTLANSNPNSVPHNFGYMEIGPDNSIYFNTTNFSYLGRIVNPNSTTASAIGAPVAFAPTYTMCNTNLSLLNFPQADKPAEVEPIIVQNTNCGIYSFSVNPCWSIYNASWDFGDGSSNFIGSVVSHTYTPGIYTVGLTLAYNGQTIPVYTKTLAVISSPVVISGPPAICKGNTYVNNYSTTNVSGALYNWSSTNAVISGPNTIPSINLVSGNTGVATLSLQVINGNCISNGTKTITIDTVPQVTITGSTLTCVGNAVFVNGNPAGGSFTGANVVSNVITPTTTGIQPVYYTYSNVNGCSNTASLSITVDACVGLVELNSKNEGLVVYPNPTDGTLFITSNTKILKIEVVNQLGQTVLQKDTLNEGNIRLEMEQLSQGIYFLQIQTLKTTLVKKVIRK